MSKEESRDLIKKYATIDTQQDDEIEKKDLEIKELKEIIYENEKLGKSTKEDLLKTFKETKVDIEEKDKTINKESKNGHTIPLKLDEEEIAIILFIERESYPSRHNVINMMKYGATKSEYLLDKFIEEGYIKEEWSNSAEDNIIKLTKMGKAYGIDHGLIK